MKRTTYQDAVRRTLDRFRAAGIVVTDEEETRVEVADFGLDDLERVGLQLLTYVNTERVCAKEMVLFPGQTCPEHMHADGVDAEGQPYAGKEETFRVRRGLVRLYVSGEGRKDAIAAAIPPTDVTVFHEIILGEGDQYTMTPNTWHWFQAGEEGAVISEFSTRSRDESDLFTDARIRRLPTVEE